VLSEEERAVEPGEKRADIDVGPSNHLPASQQIPGEAVDRPLGLVLVEGGPGRMRRTVAQESLLVLSDELGHRVKDPGI
jgi:hypothetical protein